MSTHTPGPWEAYFSVGAGWSVRKEHERPGHTGRAPICSLAWFQFPIPGLISDEISEANARLIAAAPDLLAALEQIIEMNRQHALDQYGDAEKAESWACIRVARAAIAKAGPVSAGE